MSDGAAINRRGFVKGLAGVGLAGFAGASTLAQNTPSPPAGQRSTGAARRLPARTEFVVRGALRVDDGRRTRRHHERRRPRAKRRDRRRREKSPGARRRRHRRPQHHRHAGVCRHPLAHVDDVSPLHGRRQGGGRIFSGHDRLRPDHAARGHVLRDAAGGGRSDLLGHHHRQRRLPQRPHARTRGAGHPRVDGSGRAGQLVVRLLPRRAGRRAPQSGERRAASPELGQVLARRTRPARIFVGRRADRPARRRHRSRSRTRRRRSKPRGDWACASRCIWRLAKARRRARCRRRRRISARTWC